MQSFLRRRADLHIRNPHSVGIDSNTAYAGGKEPCAIPAVLLTIVMVTRITY